MRRITDHTARTWQGQMSRPVPSRLRVFALMPASTAPYAEHYLHPSAYQAGGGSHFCGQPWAARRVVLSLEPGQVGRLRTVSRDPDHGKSQVKRRT